MELMGGCHRPLPLQPWEPCIIAIERDPFATPFDGERCEPGIGNTGSSRFRLYAKSLEDIPVPLTGLYDLAMRLPKQIFAKSERLLDRAGRPVDARIGSDPNDGTQYQWRQAKAGVAHHHAGEPRPTNRMLVGLLPPATINRRPSSMREVSVRPSAAALRLARSSRSSGSRTVVRPTICHDISLRWPYVNARRGLQLVARQYFPAPPPFR